MLISSTTKLLRTSQQEDPISGVANTIEMRLQYYTTVTDSIYKEKAIVTTSLG